MRAQGNCVYAGPGQGVAWPSAANGDFMSARNFVIVGGGCDMLKCACRRIGGLKNVKAIT